LIFIFRNFKIISAQNLINIITNFKKMNEAIENKLLFLINKYITVNKK